MRGERRRLIGLVQVGDATIPDGSVDNATAELRTGGGCSCLCRIGGWPTERSELSLPNDQEIQGPTVRPTQLEGPRPDGVAFVQKRGQGVLLESDPRNIVGCWIDTG